MRFLPLLLVLGLAACSGSTTETKPEAAAAEGAGQGKKKAKAPKPAGEEGEANGEAAEKDDGPSAPVLRTARFRVPLKNLQEADIEPLRAALVAAWEKAGKEEGSAETPSDEKSKAWKCRHATVWETTGATPAPQVRLFERLDSPDCKKEGGKEERWEVSLRATSSTRPDKKDQGGKLKYLMASQDLDWTGSAWAESFASVYRADGGETEGGFPHDDAWLKDQLPAGLTLGTKKADLDSWRWLIGTVTVGGEKIAVEAERWNCVGGDKVVGAELVFRTNKRGAGHTPNSPKDVVVTDKIKAFGDAFIKELGDRVGGEGAVSSAGLTCATGS